MRRYGGAGAVWDIIRSGPDSEGFRDFCQEHAAEFVHHGETVVAADVGDAVFDQCFFLGTKHRKALEAEKNVSALSGSGCGAVSWRGKL